MHTCIAPPSSETLVSYWLGDVGQEEASQLEEQLFECPACSASLQVIADLGRAVRDATSHGMLHAILPPKFIAQLRSRLRVREYRLKAGSSVMCTVTPQDDLVVAHLEASLTDVRRLDVVTEDLSDGQAQRLEDVAFDPSSGEVVLVSNMLRLRALGVSTHRAQLQSVEGDDRRIIGEYTFDHSPFRSEA
jgi:hypothetical protein